MPDLQLPISPSNAILLKVIHERSQAQDLNEQLATLMQDLIHTGDRFLSTLEPTAGCPRFEYHGAKQDFSQTLDLARSALDHLRASAPPRENKSVSSKDSGQ